MTRIKEQFARALTHAQACFHKLPRELRATKHGINLAFVDTELACQETHFAELVTKYRDLIGRLGEPAEYSDPMLSAYRELIARWKQLVNESTGGNPHSTRVAGRHETAI